MSQMNWLFLIMAFLLFASVLASRLSARLGMPLLLAFLGVGMLAGEEGIGNIYFVQQFCRCEFCQPACFGGHFIGRRFANQVIHIPHRAQTRGGVGKLGRVGKRGFIGRVCHLVAGFGLAIGLADGGDCRLNRCGGGVFLVAKQRCTPASAYSSHVGAGKRCKRPNGDFAGKRVD